MKRELYCPTCKKDMVLEERPINWGEGIIVKGFKCNNCGEELITLKQHGKAVRMANKRRNTLSLTRNVFKLGKSLALRIPLDIVQKLSLKPKQSVELYTNAGTIIVKPN